MRHSTHRFRRTIMGLFILYSLLMLWLLFGQRFTPLTPGTDYLQRLQGHINLIPFHTIDEFVNASARSISNSHAFINLAGNVVMFLPLGGALPEGEPSQSFSCALLASPFGGGVS